MSDIALVWDNKNGVGDFAISQNDLAVDEGFETAVILSLYLDRRAEDNDVLPDQGKDRRGWWGDAFPIVEGDKIGSRLWLLAREKQMDTVMRRAEEYAKEALQWLVDDKAAESVTVKATAPTKGTILLDIQITRPGGTLIGFRFGYNWAAQEAAG